jgi:hypothetical protein
LGAWWIERAIELKWFLSWKVRSPITIYEEFLWGITTVGEGSRLRNEFGL